MANTAKGVSARRRTLRTKITDRLARSRSAVFVPGDFDDLGGYDQVLRALRTLTSDGRLVRLGYGVYARAKISQLSNRIIIDDPNGFAGAARQALNKLKVEWRPTDAEIAYNEGRSTQIPVNPVVNIKGRFARQLSYGNRELVCVR